VSLCFNAENGLPSGERHLARQFFQKISRAVRISGIIVGFALQKA
jgi:hypothetical protein